MGMDKKRDWIILGVAVALFFIIGFLPLPAGLSRQGQWALAIFAPTIILWITQPISYPMIFFLDVFLLVVTGVFDPDTVFKGAGSPTVFFLIGAIVLAIAIKKHNLHKRMALTLLEFFGSKPSRFLLGLTCICSFLAMTMPAHGVAALLIPVTLGVLRAADRDMVGTNFSKSLMLTLTYGTSVGSMATLLGGARNPLAISLYYQATGEKATFFQWFLAAFPLALIMTFIVYLILRYIYPPEDIDMRSMRRYLSTEVEEMGPMSIGEKKSLFFFIAAFVLWMVFGTMIGITTVAMLVAVLLGLTNTLTWEDIESQLPWGIIFLYAGAITLAFGLTETGAIAYVAESIMTQIGSNPILVIFVIIVITILLSNLMSNSAATAVILPLAISILMTIGFAPVMGMYVVALPSALAFMFIIGTPASAMVYDTGQVTVKDFFKPGLALILIGIGLFMTVGLGWWKLIGLW